MRVPEGMPVMKNDQGLPAVVGIDPSLTSTGVCYGIDAETWSVVCCGSKPRGRSVYDRVHRYERLVADVMRVLETVKPAIILIEEYAYSKNSGGQMYLGEFGGILRWNMIDLTPHIYEVTASCLKKFATGKGNAPKDVVMAHVAQRYGQVFRNNDEADSFVLYQMALCAAGRIEPANQSQREAVAKVISEHQLTPEELRRHCLGLVEDKPF